MQIKKVLIDWGPVLAYAAIIFYISSLPAAPAMSIGPPGFEIGSNIKHAAEYLMLSFLLLRALANSGFRRPFLFAIIISILYGASHELHQLFVTGRHGSVLDLIFDAIGSSLITVIKM